MQPGRGLDLAMKSMHGLRSQAPSAAQDLERDLAIERHLPRLVDDAHAAAAEFAEDLEIAEAAAIARAEVRARPRRCEGVTVGASFIAARFMIGGTYIPVHATLLRLHAVIDQTPARPILVSESHTHGPVFDTRRGSISTT
ncbi:MAG: hypothetical protein U0790_16170 [Isosphaeraceae bacterium]